MTSRSPSVQQLNLAWLVGPVATFIIWESMERPGLHCRISQIYFQEHIPSIMWDYSVLSTSVWNVEDWSMVSSHSFQKGSEPSKWPHLESSSVLLRLAETICTCLLNCLSTLIHSLELKWKAGFRNQC